MSGEAAETAGTFTPRTGILLAIVGVFAFCALAVLGAYAPDLRSGDDGAGHALSRSAVGFAAAAEAVRLSGDPAFVNRSPLAAASGEGLLVVTATPATNLDDVVGLKFPGPVLIILPKWLAPPDPKHKGWVGKGLIVQPDWAPKGSLFSSAALVHAKGVARPVLRAVDGPFAAGATLAEGPVENLQSIGAQALGAKGWSSVLVDQSGATVLARDPARPIYLLAEPDLLNTQGLKNIDTLGSGLAMLHTLRRGDGPVIFDVRLNGYGRDRSLLRLMFDPPLLAVTLSLAAAALLAGFQAACRFGPALRPPPAFAFGKKALVDNSAALIRLARREHRMGERYANLTRDQVARAVGAPRGLNGEQLEAFLDRLATRRGDLDRLGDLARAARAAPDRDRLVAAARKLFRWKLEMTREGG